MRKGVIRPQQFGRETEEDDDKKAKFAMERAAERKKRIMDLGLATLVVLLLVWFFGSEEFSLGVSTSKTNVAASMPPVALLGDEATEDDEEDAEDSGNAPGELDIDDAEDDDEPKAAQLRGATEEDEEEEEEGSESESSEDSESAEPTEEVVAEEKALQAANELHFMTAVIAAKKDGKKRMSIEDYFLKLGKKSVNIASSGSYKFVLIHAQDSQGSGAYIVQGCSVKKPTCKHYQAASLSQYSLGKSGIESEVVSGGRITRHHLRNSKKAGLISVFGHSRSYPRCDDCNQKTCEFIAAAYPDYVVRWSNQGYHESDEYSIKDFQKCSAP